MCTPYACVGNSWAALFSTPRRYFDIIKDVTRQPIYCLVEFTGRNAHSLKSITTLIVQQRTV